VDGGGGGLGGKRCGAGARDGLGLGLGGWITSRQWEKKKVEEHGNGSLLHGGSSISGHSEDRISHMTGFL
jgi:hypothetical protein